jgi:spore coat protein CotF
MDTYSNTTNPLDREKTNDLLMTEKHLTDTYNTFANEATNKNLQQDLLSILNQELELEAKLFEEMQKRGWYTVEYASQTQINNVKQSYDKIQ